jgi:regulator of replication initiation timing/uncharacterized membrane protein
MEQEQSQKLNIFQRGILQKCATFLVYLVSVSISALIIDWLDKQLFIRLAEEAQRQNLLSPEAARGFTLLIEARESAAIFHIVFVILVCGFVVWLFMRWAATRNWSWPVTLPKAVEFRSAMERLGIAAPADRIAFVRKHKLAVFIALSPLIGKEHEAVRAKLYAFAHHSSLGDEGVFDRYTGMQTLCLSAGEYERILKEHGEHTTSAYSARIVALEQEITNLKAVNSLQSVDIAKITGENEKLQTENAELRKKLQTVQGREDKAEKRQNDIIPFWRVAAPLVNQLIKENTPGIQYTRPQIQDAFLLDLENFPELKPAIQKLLHTDKKEAQNTPFSLEGWGMEVIRSALGDLAKKDGGATRKAEKHRVL